MKQLNRSILFLTFFCISTASIAQYGARVKYNLNTFSGFDDYIEQSTAGSNDKIFASNIGIGLDYWFRLKNYRIEFLPEVTMGLKTSNEFDSNNIVSTTDFSSFGFNFNTQVYIFDLEGDCDCPTFSKQGPSLGKGIFLNISPGILYSTKAIDSELLDPASEESQVNFKIGVGIGYDIGISDLFTITPMFNYNLAFGLAFNDLENIGSLATKPSVIDSGMNQLQFQIRFGFRPDYVKSYGRR